ncbi:MAG: hypothetical protein IH987_13045 [Planctomycetes bacterium]|nr:hypothetical protein [Planctomycetota bacterium]
MIVAKRGFIFRNMPLLALLFCGCGTNFDEILSQSLAATGRTALDIFLTDFANAVADRAEDDSDDGDDSDGDHGTGEAIYVSNGCGGCHCADASGGCALDAPALLDVEVETLDEFLRGDTPHTGGKYDLSDQEILDLQVYLGGLE